MADRRERVILEAVTGAYDAAMIKSGLITRGIGKDATNLISTVSDMGAGTMVAAAGVAVLATAAIKFGHDAVGAFVSATDQVRSYQRVAGGSAEDSSRMVAAFHAVGVESDTGALAVFRLSQNIDAHRAALEHDGVVIARNKQGQIDLTGTVLNIADAWNHAASAQDKNTIAAEAFTKRGAVAMLPLLAAGSEQIREFWRAADEHGLVFSQQDLDNAREYRVAVNELGAAVKGFEVDAGRVIVPMLSAIAEGADTALTDVRKLANFVNETQHTSGESFLSRLNKDVNSLFAASAHQQGESTLSRINRDITNFMSFGGGQISEALAKAQAKAEQLNVPLTKEDQILRNLSVTTGVAVPRLQELAQAMGIDLATATDKERAALEQAALKLNAAITPTERLAVVTGVLSDAYSTGAERVKAYDDAIDATLGSQLDAQSSALTLRASLQGLANDLATGQRQGESYGEFQSRLSGELITVVRNIDGVRRSLVANGQLAEGTAAQQQFLVTALQEVADQYPALRGQIEAYLQTLGLIPAAVSTDVNVDTSKAEVSLGNFWTYWRRGWAQVAAMNAGKGAVGDAAVPHPDEKKNGDDALQRYLDAVHREQMNALDYRFQSGQLGIQQYIAALDGELAHERKYSDEWIQLQQKRKDAMQQLADFYTGVVDHQRELQDNEYKLGALARDQYLDLLRQRLSGLEKYSNAWTQIWEQIQQIEGDALDAELKIIQAYDAGRQYQQAFDALAGQRAVTSSWQIAMGGSPVAAGAAGMSATTYNSKSVSYEFNANGVSDPVASATLQHEKALAFSAMVGV